MSNIKPQMIKLNRFQFEINMHISLFDEKISLIVFEKIPAAYAESLVKKIIFANLESNLMIFFN